MHVSDGLVQAIRRSGMRKGMIRKEVTRPHERTKLLNTPPKWTTNKDRRNGYLDRQLEGCENSAERPVCQRPIVEPQRHDTGCPASTVAPQVREHLGSYRKGAELRPTTHARFRTTRRSIR